MSPQIFYGKARAHLLNVGLIRPAPHVSAIDINAFLIDAAGAPVDCGKVSDQDKGDIPRFLNRCCNPNSLVETCRKLKSPVHFSGTSHLQLSSADSMQHLGLGPCHLEEPRDCPRSLCLQLRGLAACSTLEMCSGRLGR